MVWTRHSTVWHVWCGEVGKGQSDVLTGRSRKMGNGMVEVVAREKANAWVGVGVGGRGEGKCAIG